MKEKAASAATANSETFSRPGLALQRHVFDVDL